MFNPLIFSVIVVPLYSKSTSKEVTFVKPKFLISTEGFLTWPVKPVIEVTEETWAFKFSKTVGV